LELESCNSWRLWLEKMGLQSQRNHSSYPQRSSSDHRFPQEGHRKHSNSRSTLESVVRWTFLRPTSFRNGDLLHKKPGPFPNCQLFEPARSFLLCVPKSLCKRFGCRISVMTMNFQLNCANGGTAFSRAIRS